MLTIDRTPMMLKFERETGGSATYFDYDDLLQMEVENKTQAYINWLEKIAKSTELKECPSCGAEVIPNPYCHDLEQRIELLEMQLEEVQAKATAYDRLMSGGKKTPKEVANFLGLIVAQDQNKSWCAYIKNPVLAEEAGYWMPTEGSFGILPIESDYSGDWKDSLTLPDGWEAD